MNEEEVKIKYILPWLTQTGLDPHELQFERTFFIRIGRQKIPITKSRNTKASARLDILVRRDDKNLLIVETKASHLSLTDDDRDQAISYARLVHPIAPYAVVTNGSEYLLYNSLTKKRINPSDIKIGGFEATLPEADIAEAQALFLRLSRANLSVFCRSQVDGELRLVKGAVTEDRKYIPELHVSREAIFNKFHEFYESELPGLLIIGQSGWGKTCELCSIAESLLAKGKPVLFFNGSSLEKGILDAIAAEFSWTFNGSYVPIQAIKRIESFVREDFLTIVVDAIDEWMFDSRSNHLASLLQAAEQRKIKVIVSCKTSVVDQFLSHRGNPTKTSLLTKRIDIMPFSPKEFYQAVEKYRHAYKFFGFFEDAVLNQARVNPFLLRVLFDVAIDSNLKHFTFSSSEFFEAYYKRSIHKTSDVRQAGETLNAIASLLYERNNDWISEGDARSSLGLRVNEHLLEELFEYSILLRSVSNSGEPAIRFYFQQFRDYIIAFKAKQFSNMTIPTLEKEFKDVEFPSMRGDVFILYYRLASKQHKLMFDCKVRENAAKYLQCYVSLIQENFPALKKTLKPYIDGSVGFIGELFLSGPCLGGYGFRPVGESNDDVYFVPVQKLFGEANLAYLDGAEGLHAFSRARGFREGIDIKYEVVESELLPQVRQLVETGRLNESNNPELLLEFIVGTLLKHKNIFQSLFTSDQRVIRYPIKLDAVLDCLLREKLTRHYKDEIIKRKRLNGEIQEVWNGTVASYSFLLTMVDEKEISQNIDRAFSEGEIPVLTTRYSDLEEFDTPLSTAIDALRANGNEIIESRFNDPLQVELISGAPLSSTDDLKTYLVKLYSTFLLNYKILIETNFPTLRSKFKLFSQLPVSVYLMIGSAVKSKLGHFSTPLSIYFVKAEPGKNVVQVVDDISYERSEGDLYFTVDGVVHNGGTLQYTKVESLFAKTSWRYDERFRGMILRKLLYSTLRDELSEVEKAFRSQVGL